MKICFFTENYYKGGLDTFLINLINAWPEPNDQITLVCNQTHAGLDTISKMTKRPLNIKGYHRLFSSSLSRGYGISNLKGSFLVRAFFAFAHRLLQYPILFPWYILTLTFFFRSNDYDRLMVVNGGYPASLLCRSALIAWRLSGKQPLGVMNFHNSSTHPPWYFKFFENLIDRLVIASASHVVAVSRNCLESLNNRRAFRGSQKLLYIYNGIEDPLEILKNNPEDNNKFHDKDYCLMLSTYEERKGHKYLLQALHAVTLKFPNLHLKIYGYGLPQEKKQIADEVVRLKLENNVTLNDFAPMTGPLLSNASILVVPSQAYESFGLTIIEAMAFSLPIVATDVGGIPEVLKDSNAGYVCSRSNPLEFADAIETILQSPGHARELGRNGRKTFERRFMAVTMAEHYATILKN